MLIQFVPAVQHVAQAIRMGSREIIVFSPVFSQVVEFPLFIILNSLNDFPIADPQGPVAIV